MPILARNEETENRRKTHPAGGFGETEAICAEVLDNPATEEGILLKVMARGPFEQGQQVWILDRDGSKIGATVENVSSKRSIAKLRSRLFSRRNRGRVGDLSLGDVGRKLMRRKSLRSRGRARQHAGRVRSPDGRSRVMLRSLLQEQMKSKPTQPQRSFPFLRVNKREGKPRKRALTEIRGPYYSVVGRRYLKICSR